MKELLKKYFITYPRSRKNIFIDMLWQKNYHNSIVLSKLILVVSFIMYLISVIDDDLAIIQYFNLFYFVTSILIFLLFTFINVKENEIRRLHKGLVYTFIFISLIWSSSIFAFSPGRYELYGTYAMILLGMASFFYLRWQVHVAFILFSLIYISMVIVMEGNFFFITPVLPKVTVVLSLYVLSMGISRIIYYKMLENFELNTDLLNRNKHIQAEVEHKTREFKIANKKLKESEKRYRELNNNLDVGVVVHNLDTSIKYCNKKAKALLGLTYNESMGRYSFSDQFVFVNDHHEEMETEEYPVNIIIKENTSLKNYVIGIKHVHEDNLIWLSVNGGPLFNDVGTIEEIIISFHDITLEKERQDEIVYISEHDFLTDLYNRYYLVETYKTLDDPEHYPLGVLMLDVNGLKIINDAYGHDVGDIALKKVADILRKSCRQTDIICRVGGDEFAVVLPNVAQDELESIKANIKERSENESVNNVALSLSAGYEIKEQDSKSSLDENFKLAEDHMYKNKLVEGISVRNNAIKAILHTLTEKYEKEKIHSMKVGSICKKIGEALSLNEEEIKELELAGMYHDIGKISLPDAILNKPGKLTKKEFETIKTHPEISYQILRAADEYSDLAKHALHHHERWDGYGYPSGIKGEDIPLFSRIICVADAYEAMTAVRVYKEQMSEDEAVEEMIQCSGSQFDERIARTFVEKVLHKTWKT